VHDLFNLWPHNRNFTTPGAALNSPGRKPGEIVLFAVRWAQYTWGEPGVFVSAGVLGLTDIDALVVSMAKDTGAQLPAETAAAAIAIGVLSNTLMKLGGGDANRSETVPQSCWHWTVCSCGCVRAIQSFGCAEANS